MVELEFKYVKLRKEQLFGDMIQIKKSKENLSVEGIH